MRGEMFHGRLLAQMFDGGEDAAQMSACGSAGRKLLRWGTCRYRGRYLSTFKSDCTGT